jgi:ATP-dependent DNA helicase DinG
MPDARDLVEAALERLAERPGFVKRDDQAQLALLLSDCIEGDASGVFEAPTGLGKSLAALIPAIAHAMATGKRTVIATYTNVLAEQYWRHDLPLALSLFPAELDGKPSLPRCEFLIGRQRYACWVAMAESAPDMLKEFAPKAELGIESEFRNLVKLGSVESARTWRQIGAPPVCPARLCPKYDQCFYYKARRSAERAPIVITNHSVVMQDAILWRASDGESTLLGEYSFLIVDEAHDFPAAALGALEFELSESRLGVLAAVTNKLEQSVLPLAAEAGRAKDWLDTCESFRGALTSCQSDLREFGLGLRRSGILAAAPAEVADHPQVRGMKIEEERARDLATGVARRIGDFLEAIGKALASWKGEEGKELADEAKEAIRSYQLYIREFGWGCEALFAPGGVSVSYAIEGAEAGRWSQEPRAASLRHDTVALAEPLREMLWERLPYACLSATLALDGDFEFFRRVTGVEPRFEEVLPSPFDYKAQAALYLPKPGSVPDPSLARKEGTEEQYFDALARELGAILEAVGGRTLALFHSRREMEAVYERIIGNRADDSLEIYVQRRSGASSVGERFRKNTNASLFAVRSFWTGFDAPGETLSCVALVRVPFEVPVDPPQVARQAWMQSQGLDPFGDHALPVAKMMMRQGAGRLIRRSDDRGLIALLDPRLRSKRYGEEILRNLPEMRVFDDPAEACAYLGLGAEGDGEPGGT